MMSKGCLIKKVINYILQLEVTYAQKLVTEFKIEAAASLDYEVKKVKKNIIIVLSASSSVLIPLKVYMVSVVAD